MREARQVIVLSRSAAIAALFGIPSVVMFCSPIFLASAAVLIWGVRQRA